MTSKPVQARILMSPPHAHNRHRGGTRPHKRNYPQSPVVWKWRIGLKGHAINDNPTPIRVIVRRLLKAALAATIITSVFMMLS